MSFVRSCNLSIAFSICPKMLNAKSFLEDFNSITLNLPP